MTTPRNHAEREAHLARTADPRELEIIASVAQTCIPQVDLTMLMNAQVIVRGTDAVAEYLANGTDEPHDLTPLAVSAATTEADADLTMWRALDQLTFAAQGELLCNVRTFHGLTQST